MPQPDFSVAVDLARSTRWKASTLARRHAALLVMGSGAAVLLASNLLLGKMLTAAEFGEYALLATLVTVQGAFGFLGIDHASLRLASVEPTGVALDRRLASVMPIAALVTALALTGYAWQIGATTATVAVLVPVLVVISFGVAAAQWLRLVRRYASAQVSLNLWRILFGLLLVGTLPATTPTLNIAYATLVAALLVSSATTAVLLRGELAKLSFDVLVPSRVGFVASYFVSLLIVTALNAVDRLVIMDVAGKEALGIYFYNYTLAAAPFGLLSSYSGFRELGEFKQRLSAARLLQALRRNCLLGIAMAGGIAFSLQVFESAGVLVDSTKLDWVLLLLFMATGLIKVCYAVLSSAMGAVADPRTIQWANAASILVLAVGLLVMFRTSADIRVVALVLALMWLFRSIFYGIGAGRVVRS